MRDARAIRAALAGALCVAILIGTLVSHAWPLWAGSPVYLRVQPVDPRDLFRGDYVILSYDMQQLLVADPQAPAPDSQNAWTRRAVRVKPIGDWWMAAGTLPPGAAIYVQLEAKPIAAPGVPREHAPLSVSDRPVEGAVNLRGILTWVQNEAFEPRIVVLNVSYGIDAFFVQEHTGKPIEQAIAQGKAVFAEVYLTPSGKARVADLLIEGQRLSPR